MSDPPSGSRASGRDRDSPRVRPASLGADALLRRYADAGAYTDCFEIDLPRRVTFEEYVEAFYSTPLFRAERLILRWGFARASTDAELAELAQARGSRFAAWQVEARAPDQLLLGDFTGRTRSWLQAIAQGDAGSTRLRFGSAVLPVRDTGTGASRMGPAFRILLPLHRVYARMLLRAAWRRLQRIHASGAD